MQDVTVAALSLLSVPELAAVSVQASAAADDAEDLKWSLVFRAVENLSQAVMVAKLTEASGVPSPTLDES